MMYEVYYNISAVHAFFNRNFFSLTPIQTLDTSVAVRKGDTNDAVEYVIRELLCENEQHRLDAKSAAEILKKVLDNEHRPDVTIPKFSEAVEQLNANTVPEPTQGFLANRMDNIRAYWTKMYIKIYFPVSSYAQ